MKTKYVLYLLLFNLVMLFSDDYSNNLNKLILDSIKNQKIVLFPDCNHADGYNDYLFYNFVSAYQKKFPNMNIIIALEMPYNYDYRYVLQTYSKDKLEDMYQYMFQLSLDIDQYELSRLCELSKDNKISIYGLEDDEKLDIFKIGLNMSDNNPEKMNKVEAKREILIADRLNKIVEENKKKESIIFVYYGAGHLSLLPVKRQDYMKSNNTKIEEEEFTEFYRFPYYLSEKDDLAVITDLSILKTLHGSVQEIKDKHYLFIERYNNENIWFNGVILNTESKRAENIFYDFKKVGKKSELAKRIVKYEHLFSRNRKIDVRAAYKRFLESNKSDFIENGWINTRKISRFLQYFTKLNRNELKLINRENSIDKIVDITSNGAIIKNYINTLAVGYPDERANALKELKRITGKEYTAFLDWFEWYYLGE